MRGRWTVPAVLSATLGLLVGPVTALHASTVPAQPPATRTLRSLIEDRATADSASATLAVGETVEETGSATTSAVSYESDGLTITGVLRVPAGEGPFPAVVLVHGFVDESYVTGGELVREQEHFVDSGYVVLATDLRGFGGSDVDPATGSDFEMGWTIDAINAAVAVAGVDAVDPSRVALIGHSLGGLVVLNAMVVAPDAADAVVAMAPSSTDVWQNIEQFATPGDPVWTALVDPHGTPRENPDFWADLSPRTFVDRATAPLLIVQGTADDAVDPAWSDDTAEVWRQAGKAVEVMLVDGADHVFDPRWDDAIAAVDDFLADTLGPA